MLCESLFSCIISECIDTTNIHICGLYFLVYFTDFVAVFIFTVQLTIVSV